MFYLCLHEAENVHASPPRPASAGKGWPPDSIWGEGHGRLDVAVKCNMSCNPRLFNSMPSSRAAKRRGHPGEPWAPWVPPDRRVALRAPRDDGPVGARLARHGRPGIPLQAFEKVKSAPGIAPALAVAARSSLLRDATRCVAPHHEGGTFRSAPFGYSRPENWPQAFERVKSAPGIAPALAVAARSTVLRDATRCVAPRHEGGTFRSAASASDWRPGIPLQTVERLNPRPEIRSLRQPLAVEAQRETGAARMEPPASGRRPAGRRTAGRPPAKSAATP